MGGDLGHVLVVGGTGMLAAASVELAARARVLTSVARTRRSLAALDARVAPLACLHRTLPLDWSDRDAFVAGLRRDALGGRDGVPPPDLAVAWLHDDALGLEVGRALGASGVPCRFFQVLGSAAAQPGRDAPRIAESLAAFASLSYHEVVLGFRREPGGSRWLTNDEISRGVLDAIRRGAPRRVVGAVRPWRERP